MNRRRLAVCTVAAAVALSCHVSARMTDNATLVNTFSVRPEQAKATLTEPSWDPESALKTVPGSVVAKDPQIKNTSDAQIWELAGMRIEFVYTEACPVEADRGKTLSAQDIETLCSVYSLDYEADRQGTTDWIRFGQEDSSMPVQHFYYASALGQGETTCPLFTKISAQRQTTNAGFRRIQEMGGFQIIVEGAVLSVAEPTAQAGREACENGSFVFPSEKNG